MSYTIDIRQRRQVTLPNEVLKQMGVTVGDSIEIKVEGKKAVLKPKKQIALEALKEMQRIVRESGISEKEMQENVRRIRRQINEERAS
ncbi:MAG: Transcriptional regulator, AbrB family [Microgenomates group bacterium GW2011_GWC1_37_8]|uniref:Transcriptional regulator, AbrB family n=2 Tax=Candidatus Woeseibacteriota TaxID=1752722 RepID=A0A0G0P9P8_9BACT|nr:MAG: Transcriptional regulator, AbrB family [Microgenomates group bacterium GW2011_GWC1_37_8]KKQ86051.1 MAG: Transcriptional regulator, AbrB family [Candidatus Woesebacteria bacterium GW2011_GWB1_38_8]OGM21202.1 MAG: hypothetical protein A2863_04105 [Candidatus Woesebacteria bacterium RIFCSPHIGHO2_01_FULL_38_9b]